MITNEKKLVILGTLLNLIDDKIKDENIDGTVNQIILGNKYVPNEKVSILELEDLLKKEFIETKKSLRTEK